LFASSLKAFACQTQTARLTLLIFQRLLSAIAQSGYRVIF
jgi:hypothetical protein